MFVYNACLTEAEMQICRGFGHSSWQKAVALAQAVFADAFFARGGQATRL